VEEITEAGTIDDLVADADAAPFDCKATPRLIRDWSQLGLLDYPQRRPAGKGHGSAPALYPASQRNLLLTLLRHRPTNGIRSLARIPVGIWLYWGDTYVSLSQARRSLMTWLGDPRASKREARESAQAILGLVDSPVATARARRELLAELTYAAWTGQPDFQRIEQAVRAVFEPSASTIIRAVGHPAAPIMTDSMMAVMKARFKAVSALLDGDVTDAMLEQARDAHRFAYAEYATRQPFLAAKAPSLYEPITAEETLNRCCGHLLSTLGMEILHPDAATRLQRERAFRRPPGLAAFGLTMRPEAGASAAANSSSQATSDPRRSRPQASPSQRDSS